MKHKPLRDPSVTGPDRAWTIALVLAPVLVFLLVWIETSLAGAGWTWDAVRYISTARSIADDNGFHDYSGAPFLLWPPLFPMILAAAEIVGLDAHAAARLLNALSLAFLVFAVAGSWLRDIPMPAFRWLGLGALVVAPMLVEQAGFAWTEPFFGLVIVLGLIALERLSEPTSSAKNRRRWLLTAAALASMAVLQRYAGLTLVIIGAVVAVAPRAPANDDLIHSTPRASLRQRLGDLSIFLVVSLAPLAAWSMHLVSIGTGPLGPRFSSPFELRDILGAALEIVSGWILPRSLALLPRLLAVAACVAAVGYGTFAERYESGYDRNRDRRRLLTGWSLLYAAFVVVSSARIQLEPFNERFLAPLYPVLVVLLADALSQATSRTAEIGRPRLAAALVTLACFWMAWPTVRTFENVARFSREGLGDYAGLPTPLQDYSWKQSPLLRALQSGRNETGGAGSLLFSNRPDAVYALTGIAAHALPWRADATETFVAAIAAGAATGETARIAWFSRSVAHEPALDTRLLSHVVVLSAPVYFADGVLYAVRPRLNSDSASAAVASSAAAREPASPIETRTGR